MAATFSFIVPVRNDAARLERCLNSVRHCGLPPERLEVLVVDNGSVDDSVGVADRSGARVLKRPGLKVSQMRNEAAALARGEYLALVDADHEVTNGWLAAASEALHDTGAVAAGAHYDPPPGANWVQRSYDRFRQRCERRQETDWLGSGNLVVRSDAFQAIGGFDASLESCEDVDLCNRIRAAGHRIVYEPRMRSIHHGDPASLKAVFLGELWRGRDNLRVTLRGPLTIRALPSLLIPMGNALACVCALPMAMMTGRWALLLLPVLTLAGATVLRALRMRRGRMSGGKHEGLALVLAQNLAVAAAYEAGRAAAMVFRASHRTRRAQG